jgi:hypothetical protein
VRRIIGTAVAAACACLLPAGPTHAATAEGAGVVVGINAIRAGRGLRPLELHPELERKAEDWAAHLAAIGTLVHSGFTDGITVKWLALAENVVAEQTIDQAEQKVVSSPVHYANIVDPDMTHIGVGIAAGGGQIYLVEEFMQLQTSPAPTAESTATAPTATVTSAGPAVTAAPPTPVTTAPVTTATVSAGAPAPLPTPAPAPPKSAEPSAVSAPAPPPASAPTVSDTVQAVSSPAIATSPEPPVIPAAHIAADGSGSAEDAAPRGAWTLPGLVGLAAFRLRATRRPVRPHRRARRRRVRGEGRCRPT